MMVQAVPTVATHSVVVAVKYLLGEPHLLTTPAQPASVVATHLAAQAAVAKI